jgi:hypothetical protein
VFDFAILRRDHLERAEPMKDASDTMSGIPADPSGIDEPHDVLAAEEFAMPAPGDTDSGLFGAGSPAEAASHPAAIAGMIALLLLLLVALKRRR